MQARSAAHLGKSGCKFCAQLRRRIGGRRRRHSRGSTAFRMGMSKPSNNSQVPNAAAIFRALPCGRHCSGDRSGTARTEFMHCRRHRAHQACTQCAPFLYTIRANASDRPSPGCYGTDPGVLRGCAASGAHASAAEPCRRNRRQDLRKFRFESRERLLEPPLLSRLRVLLQIGATCCRGLLLRKAGTHRDNP